jgi:hypothetical protein
MQNYWVDREFAKLNDETDPHRRYRLGEITIDEYFHRREPGRVVGTKCTQDTTKKSEKQRPTDKLNNQRQQTSSLEADTRSSQGVECEQRVANEQKQPSALYAALLQLGKITTEQHRSAFYM